MRTWRIATVATLGILSTLLSQGCASGSRAGEQANEGPPPKPRPAPALNAQTYFAHGHLLERQGNFEGAAQQYRKALELNANLIVARNRLGITLNKQGKNADAVAVFRDAVRQRPDLAHLQNNLGFSLLLNGSYADAEAATRKALDIRPDFRRARMNHGIVLAKLGRFEEAYGEFKAVCSRDDAMYNLAMVKADAGRYSEAISILREALVLNPAFEPAQKEIERLAQQHQSAPAVVASNITTVERAATPAPVAGLASEADPSASGAAEDARIRIADVSSTPATPGAVPSQDEPNQAAPPEPTPAPLKEEPPASAGRDTGSEAKHTESRAPVEEEARPAQAAPASDGGVTIKDVTPGNPIPPIQPATPSPAEERRAPEANEDEQEEVETARVEDGRRAYAVSEEVQTDERHVDAFEVAALAAQLRWCAAEALDETRLDETRLAAFTTVESATTPNATTAGRSGGIESILRFVSRILSYFGLVPWLGVEPPDAHDETDSVTIQVLGVDDAEAFLRRTLGFQLDLLDPSRAAAMRPVIE